MSAGTGISHSEFNASSKELVHFLQIWILPAVRNLKPSWEQRRFPPEARQGRLLPVASGNEALLREDGVVRIHQDATLYLAALGAGEKLRHEVSRDRRAYLFAPSGAIGLKEHQVASGDVAKVTGEVRLSFDAQKSSEILLIDLP